ADSWIARMGKATWLDDLGLEIFYGHGIKTVLGQHPGGETYVIDGRVTPAPGWLLQAITPAKEPQKPKKKRAKAARGAVEARLEGLPKQLAELDPGLEDPKKIGWHRKPHKGGGEFWVGNCPYPHESGRNGPDDLSCGVGEAGRPWVHCLHSSCDKV